MTEDISNLDSSWELPRDAGRRHDPLLECLVVLSRIHGAPCTRDALTAGLPLVDQVLTPSIFERAARRASLASKVLRRGLDSLTGPLLPVVLLLRERNACLLIGWEADGSARVVFPELGEAAST